MVFEEAVAQELITKYNLSEKTLIVWRHRNSIPDRYSNNYVKPGFDASKRIEVDKLMRVLTSDKLITKTFSMYANVDENKIWDVNREHTSFNDDEFIRLKKSINDFRLSIYTIISSMNKTVTIDTFTENKFRKFLSYNYIVENHVFDKHTLTKLNGWKMKRSVFPTIFKSNIIQALMVLHTETSI